MTDDIKLPPLPRLQVPLIEADVDLIDIKVLAQWCERTATDYARAAVEADRIKREDYINDDRDQLRAEIVALKGTIADLEARAERLAEVLREAQPFIGWTGSYPELHAKIDALLRDQEEDHAQ